MATRRRGRSTTLALTCLLVAACGQKGPLALDATRQSLPKPPPDTLIVPGVSPADMPASAPPR